MSSRSDERTTSLFLAGYAWHDGRNPHTTELGCIRAVRPLAETGDEIGDMRSAKECLP